MKILRTPIGHLIFTANNDLKCEIYSYPDFGHFQTLETDVFTNHISSSDDGRFVLYSNDNNQALLYKMNTSGYYELYYKFPIGDFGSSFSKYSNYLAILSSKKKIHIYSKENLIDPIRIVLVDGYNIPKFSPFYNDIFVYYYILKNEIHLVAMDIKQNNKQEIIIDGNIVHGMTFNKKGDKLYIAFGDSQNNSKILGFYFGKDKTFEKLRNILTDLYFQFE